MLIKININNEDIKMKVESGPSVTLMSFESYYKNLPGKKL